MNTDNIRDFIQDLFTLRTVWIDKGRGRWTVKKRLHPLLKAILCTLGVVLCAVVYSGINALPSVEAEPQTLTVTAKLPEPVHETRIEPEPVAALVAHTEPQPVRTLRQEEKEISAPPVKDSAHIIIPISTAKPAPKQKAKKAANIVLPSEMNPDTDRIIPGSTRPKPAPVNNGKYNIRISKSTYTLSLYKGRELVKEYPVAVGRNPGDKQRTGDNRTPVGNFKIISIENASKWSHDFRDGKGKIAGAYGPWFLRLDAKGWKGIGIHGTHDPDSRGTNATEGCIRLSNEDIAELRQYAYRNMPVVISED